MDDREDVAYASPPCMMHELDPISLGYLPRDEVVALLNVLLEAERAGARAVGRMARDAADDAARRALAKIAADEAAFCAMLSREIRRLGGQPSRATGAFYGKVMGLARFEDRLALLDRGQSWVARKLAEALPRIADDGLHRDLRDMLHVHQRNIEACERLLDPSARAGEPL